MYTRCAVHLRKTYIMVGKCNYGKCGKAVGRTKAGGMAKQCKTHLEMARRKMKAKRNRLKAESNEEKLEKAIESPAVQAMPPWFQDMFTQMIDNGQNPFAAYAEMTEKKVVVVEEEKAPPSYDDINSRKRPRDVEEKTSSPAKRPPGYEGEEQKEDSKLARARRKATRDQVQRHAFADPEDDETMPAPSPAKKVKTVDADLSRCAELVRRYTKGPGPQKTRLTEAEGKELDVLMGQQLEFLLYM